MLEISNLYQTFNAGSVNEVTALKDVSLDIQSGEFVCVLGTNGSGKSTLLNAVAGNFIPDSGRIILNGLNMTRWPEHRRARHIGRVFQNPVSGTAPSMSIGENLSLAAKRGKSRGLGWGLPASALRELKIRIKTLNMGLEDRLDTPIGKLSGGQRQALTMLMACWLKPDLLFSTSIPPPLIPKQPAR